MTRVSQDRRGGWPEGAPQMERGVGARGPPAPKVEVLKIVEPISPNDLRTCHVQSYFGLVLLEAG